MVSFFLLNGNCLGALSNERLTRLKNDEAYPKEAIDGLLNQHSVNKWYMF